MSTLASGPRSELERVVIKAREAAETGARAALEALAVHHKALYPHMSSELRQLRSQLRAKARQLGDRRLHKVAADGTDQQIDHLVAECAYEQWHRMLFARFLAENGLLIEPEEKMAIQPDGGGGAGERRGRGHVGLRLTLRPGDAAPDISS